MENSRVKERNNGRDHIAFMVKSYHTEQTLNNSNENIWTRRSGSRKTVKTGHGTTDWSEIRKGVHQGCKLSPCLFNLYAEYICQMPGWMKHKLESRLPGEISITSDTQMAPPLWQKAKKNQRAT